MYIGRFVSFPYSYGTLSLGFINSNVESWSSIHVCYPDSFSVSVSLNKFDLHLGRLRVNRE